MAKSKQTIDWYQTAFKRCQYIFENGKNVKDRLLVHTKMAHSLPADFEKGNLGNGILASTI